MVSSSSSSSGHLVLMCLTVMLLCGGTNCTHVRTDGTQVSADPEPVTAAACRIFCNNTLLHYIQMAKIFNDSKYFVDMKLKTSPKEIERSFDKILRISGKHPKTDLLSKFLAENFEFSNAHFIDWVPDDWNPDPKLAYDVYDRSLRNWVYEVNEKWKLLGRRLSDDVRENNDHYSHIYLPHPFIVPGGRFRELYYWDSYWIIEGLLLSDMTNTAKGMIRNFLHLVREFGYVPNGCRKYYIGRSQPPLLTSMVDLYWKHTRDVEFLKESITALETEYHFWQNNRSVILTIEDKDYRLFQYNVSTTSPRPESYKEDMELVGSLSEAEKVKVFSEIKSAAESGWDFSSRWFLANGKHTLNMTDISTRSIAPVCLNSLMGLNARLISEFFGILGNDSKHEEYKVLADETNTTMSRVFWSDRDGVWLDYNIVKKELIPGFYSSNLMPLWTDTYGKERTPEFLIEQAIAYLDRNGISNYPGGIPTSLLHSGQQWDMPNGWAPLQHFVVLGLHKAGRFSHRAKDRALSFARAWILNVYQTYRNTTPHALFEKYWVNETGKIGGGGEYMAQVGFGWTNGVVLKFLSMYGHHIKTRDVSDPAPLVVGLLLVVVALVSVASYVRRVQACHGIKWETRT